jgi:hypothetical protein
MNEEKTSKYGGKKNIENLFDEIANFYVKDLLNYENDRFTFK